jgi:uncharacterized protein (TIGR01777 family)
MKQIVIAGASGFIGKALMAAFKAKGWRVVAVSRSASSLGADQTVAWRDDPASPLGTALSESEALINLSGRSIMTRFTPKTMDEIRSSRVETTQMLARLMGELKSKPQVWVNASAIGIYGDRGEKVLTEASQIGTGFLPDACDDWEKSIFQADLPEVRRAAIRIGIVLGQGGGAFEQLSKVTKLMAGSALGDGRQYLSWIHLEDLVRMFVWAVETDGVCGPINGTAPNPVTNAEMMAAFRSAYGRPFVPPAPSFVLKMVMPMLNMEASLLLEGQRVVPELALSKGFTFNYPRLDGAMAQLVQ